jgi:hypothetical protein
MPTLWAFSACPPFGLFTIKVISAFQGVVFLGELCQGLHNPSSPPLTLKGGKFLSPSWVKRGKGGVTLNNLFIEPASVDVSTIFEKELKSSEKIPAIL